MCVCVYHAEKSLFINAVPCRSAISANALYLEAEAREGSDRLAKNTPGGPEIIGAVYIHPSAHVDPTAKVMYRIEWVLCVVVDAENLLDWAQCVYRPSC